MSNYRQQTTSTQALLGCPSCDPGSVSVTVCYSSVSAEELCCEDASGVVIWIPFGQTFNGTNPATIFYSDELLTTRSPAGFYSNDLASCTPPPSTSYTGIFLTSVGNVNAFSACNDTAAGKRWHDGAGAYPIIGNTIYQGPSVGSAIETWSGYKGMAIVSGGSMKNLSVNASGVVISVSTCIF